MTSLLNKILFWTSICLKLQSIVQARFLIWTIWKPLLHIKYSEFVFYVKSVICKKPCYRIVHDCIHANTKNLRYSLKFYLCTAPGRCRVSTRMYPIICDYLHVETYFCSIGEKIWLIFVMVEFNRAIVMSWVYCFWAEDVSQWVIDIRLNSVVLRRYLRSKYGRRRTSPGSLEPVVMAVHTDISRILWANASVKSKLPWQVDSVHYRKETPYIYHISIVFASENEP